MKRKLIMILALFCIVTTTFIGCGKKEEVKEESKIEANADESNLKENNKEGVEKQQEEEKGDKGEENKKNKEEDIKSNGDKDSMNKPTDKPNGASNGDADNGNSDTPVKPNPSKPKPTPPVKPNPDKPKPPVKPDLPKPPVKPTPPKPTPPPVKPDPPKEKVYTGKQAAQTLLNKGYEGHSGSAYYTDGSMEVMRMSVLSGKWDMVYSTQSFDSAYAGHHQAFCNAMMPGYGGNLYNLLKSNKNQTTKLGGRTVQVVIEAYGVKLRISPING